MTKSSGFAGLLSGQTQGWAGVFALLGVGVIGNLLATIIALIVGSSICLFVLWSLAILAFLAGIYAVWGKTKPPKLVPPDEKPAKHRGLILIISRGRKGVSPAKQSAEIAIDYHLAKSGGLGLEAVWMIASTGVDGSLPYAQELAEICEAEKGLRLIKIFTVDDAYGIMDTYRVVMEIYEKELDKAGLHASEVIADFTGGTHPMAAGMVLACRDRFIMQYMYGPDVASEPRQVTFTP